MGRGVGVGGGGGGVTSLREVANFCRFKSLSLFEREEFASSHLHPTHRLLLSFPSPALYFTSSLSITPTTPTTPRQTHGEKGEGGGGEKNGARLGVYGNGQKEKLCGGGGVCGWWW